MNSLGIVSLEMNKPVEARQFYARALDLARVLNSTFQESVILTNLAELEFHFGSRDKATELSRKAIVGYRSLDRPNYLGPTLDNLASYLIAGGHLREARVIAEEGLSIVREDRGYDSRVCLQIWGLLLALDRHYKEAALILGFVEAGYLSSGEIRQRTEQKIFDRLSTLVAASLSFADIRSYETQAAQWSEQQALDFVYNLVISSRRSMPTLNLVECP
jgi:tetratricopeptide (TPR) repeat protein